MRTYNEARACFICLKLQTAPPCDVERARVYMTGFQAPRSGFLMRVRLSRRKADVFTPRPGSRERFESRMKTERELLQQKKESVRRAYLVIAEEAVKTRSFVNVELPLPAGLTWEEAMIERSLFRRRIRERSQRASRSAPTMFIAVRERDGQPDALSVLCDEELDNVGMLIDARIRRRSDSETINRRRRRTRLLQSTGVLNASCAERYEALPVLSQLSA